MINELIYLFIHVHTYCPSAHFKSQIQFNQPSSVLRSLLSFIIVFKNPCVRTATLLIKGHTLPLLGE